jgi:uncharacterized membrane protein
MSKHKHPHDPAASRRDQFIAPLPRRRAGISWNAVIVAAGLLFVAAAIYSTRSRPVGGFGSTADSELLPAGDVTLAASLFGDGQARFYRYTTSIGREIRFFVMKSSDGVVRAAFDTCDVCYRERRGYRQSGDVMICNNCGRTFPSNSINVIQGGCNPAPVERSIQGDRVVLKAASLELGAAYF